MRLRIFFNRAACALILACALAFATSAVASQQRMVDDDEAGEIENFGKVNDNFYRGAQPKAHHYKQLAARGVKTIVDLRADPAPQARSEAERAGLLYLNLPLEEKRSPRADAAGQFLKIVNDPANWPVYVHCKGGRHRTGAMTAVYRMTVDGWDLEQAYQEMKRYDFYTRWGHKCFKEYVHDYYLNFVKPGLDRRSGH